MIRRIRRSQENDHDQAQNQAHLHLPQGLRLHPLHLQELQLLSRHPSPTLPGVGEGRPSSFGRISHNRATVGECFHAHPPDAPTRVGLPDLGA